MAPLPSLCLIYFPVRARAECAHMIIAYGDIDCKEEHCNIYFGMSFQEVKEKGLLPFGQVPVLEVKVPDKEPRLIGQCIFVNHVKCHFQVPLVLTFHHSLQVSLDPSTATWHPLSRSLISTPQMQQN